ncbi:hypothetical protein BS50DRAFT_671749 [Corynespora cassiicola Philippines]|uniref:F-box domain-containing protein n=1 Tax=Corynespora cassiicola Philippines TaxID=1448308 RepID=A0A2T2P4S2_CORCC|nr:hypothetical protein BS50DRAFT_671749 [Corynespora cassiicola Philippines]
MGLADLPTELDKHIISYMMKSDLNIMSRVNRYYRQISEPFLYRNIHVCINPTNQVISLLRVITERKELASYIETLVPKGSRLWLDRFTPNPQVRGIKTEIMALIHAIGDSCLEANDKIKWVNEALSGNGIALFTILFTLAENLKNLNLDHVHSLDLSLMFYLLRNKWEIQVQTRGIITTKNPLNKLESLTLYMKTLISLIHSKSPVLHTVKDLVVLGYFDIYSHDDFGYDILNGGLTRLELRGYDMYFEKFKSDLSQPTFGKLEELHLVDTRFCMGDQNEEKGSDSDDHYNFEKLPQVLRAFQPDLQIPRIIGTAKRERPPPIRSIQGLSKLVTLILDEHLLSGWQSLHHLKFSQAHFPSSLQKLHLYLWDSDACCSWYASSEFWYKGLPFLRESDFTFLGDIALGEHDFHHFIDVSGHFEENYIAFKVYLISEPYKDGQAMLFCGRGKLYCPGLGIDEEDKTEGEREKEDENHNARYTRFKENGIRVYGCSPRYDSMEHSSSVDEDIY